MTCYLRHLRELFDVLGLAYDADTRERVDAAIRTVLDMSGDATCSEVWSAVKALPTEARESLPERVGKVLG